jgi:hypothetical protein
VSKSYLTGQTVFSLLVMFATNLTAISLGNSEEMLIRFKFPKGRMPDFMVQWKHFEYAVKKRQLEYIKLGGCDDPEQFNFGF